MSPSPVLVHKLRAGVASLLVYLVFAAVLALLVSRAWYPGYLFWLDGGLQGLQLVLAVALVLGPLLAVVVFHPEKSRGKLLFDIAVIALLQVGSMAWGLWQAHQQRPVAVVYGSNRFISVAPAIMARQQETAATLARFSPDRPPLVYRRQPQTRKEELQLQAMLFRAGLHPEAQVWLYEPLAGNLGQVFGAQDVLRTFVLKQLASDWAAWVEGRERTLPEDYRLALFEGRFGNAVLVFSPGGQLQGYLDLHGMPLPSAVVDIPPASVSR